MLRFPHLGTIALVLSLAIACSKKNDSAAPQAAADIPAGADGCTVVSTAAKPNQKVCYKTVNGKAMWGDIILNQSAARAAKLYDLSKTSKTNPRLGSIVLDQNMLWTNQTSATGTTIDIPYVVDPSFAKPALVSTLNQELASKTSIRLVPRANEADYVVFAAETDANACGSSPVGRQGGRQYVYINFMPGYLCDNLATIAHEFGHALGLWHEQSRIDRDNYIRVFLENIIPGYAFNFDQKLYDGRDQSDYDYDSVMHYDALAFSYDGLHRTMEGPNDAITARLGKATSYSPGDVATLEASYGFRIRIAVDDDEKGATLTWFTKKAGNSVVKYGFASGALDQTVTVDGNVTQHSVHLASLLKNTKYFFKVSSTDADGVTKTSAVSNFITDGTPPTISDMRFNAQTPTTADIRWTTDEPTGGYVFYYSDEEQQSDGLYSYFDNVASKIHGVTITDLDPAKNYFFVVVATDLAGNYAFSDPQTLPSFVRIAVSGTPTVTLAGNVATLKFDTNVAGSTAAVYLTDFSGDSTYLEDPDDGSTLHHTIQIPGLAANKIYYVQGIAHDRDGYRANTKILSFSTYAGAPAIDAVASANVTDTGFSVTWTTNPATQGSVQVIEDFGLPVAQFNQSGSLTSHAVNVTGLTPDTYYYFLVTAEAATGAKATSRLYVIKTNPVPAPTIADVAIVPTANSAHITWSTDRPGDSVVAYFTTQNDLKIFAVEQYGTSHVVDLANLKPNTAYTVMLQSTDSDGNASDIYEGTFSTGAAQTPDSVSIVSVDRDSFGLIKGVNAKSTKPNGGATGMALKLVDPFGGVVSTTAMTFRAADGTYHGDISSANGALIKVGALRIRVESSLGGSATY